MTYRATQFDLGPDSLTKFGEDLTRRMQDTMVDAQETLSKTLSKTMESGNPLDVWSLQAAFGMRTAQRWMDLSGFGVGSDVPSPQPESTPSTAAPSPAPASTAVEPECTAEADIAAEPVLIVEDEVAVVPTVPAEIAAPAKDDLQRIRGIGPAIAAKLELQGITDFAQLARLTTDQVAALDAAMDLKGRIERDEWITQAAGLASKV
jgi:predicted flap endonuclease-1-like 5' DNA nuclease